MVNAHYLAVGRGMGLRTTPAAFYHLLLIFLQALRAVFSLPHALQAGIINAPF